MGVLHAQESNEHSFCYFLKKIIDCEDGGSIYHKLSNLGQFGEWRSVLAILSYILDGIVDHIIGEN